MYGFPMVGRPYSTRGEDASNRGIIFPIPRPNPRIYPAVTLGIWCLAILGNYVLFRKPRATARLT